MVRILMTAAIAVSLTVGLTAQQGTVKERNKIDTDDAKIVTWMQVDPNAERAPLARGYRTRALAFGWGHSWLHGWPGYGKAITDIEYVGFYPQWAGLSRTGSSCTVKG